MKIGGKKVINEVEFEAAKKAVMDEMIDDPQIDGMAKVMIPLTGAIFADKMFAILFRESEES